MYGRLKNQFRKYIISLLCLFVAYSTFVSSVIAESLPGFYGIYAVDKGSLTELTNESETINYHFSPQVNFIVFDKNIGYVANGMTLSRMRFFRNKIHQGADIDGRRNGVVAYKQWVSERWSGSDIPLRSKPIKNENEMVYLVPRSELKTGAYVVEVNGKTIGNFFVNKKLIDDTLAESDYCVDLLIPPGLMALAAQATGYEKIPCKGAGKVETSLPSLPIQENRRFGSTESPDDRPSIQHDTQIEVPDTVENGALVAMKASFGSPLRAGDKAEVFVGSNLASVLDVLEGEVSAWGLRLAMPASGVIRVQSKGGGTVEKGVKITVAADMAQIAASPQADPAKAKIRTTAGDTMILLSGAFISGKLTISGSGFRVAVSGSPNLAVNPLFRFNGSVREGDKIQLSMVR